MNSKKIVDSEKLDIKSIMRDVVEIAKLSYEQEQKREQSLLSVAGQMLTAFSFSSVAVLMSVPLLINFWGKNYESYILNCTLLTMIFFIGSMVLALLVEWRYKYTVLPSPLSIFDHISKNADFFNTEEQRNKSWVQMLDDTWNSKHRLNDKRAKLITASMILFFCGVFSIFIAIVFRNIFI